MEKFTLRQVDDLTTVCYYPPEKKKTDIGIVIFLGGGYRNLAKHEGEAYAHLFKDWGIAAFVVEYRVFPHHFPSQLLDARDAICFVRSNAGRLGINKEKILAMGSSAGGHLVSLLCNYHQAIHTDKRVQKEQYLPNGQILCYPVISAEVGKCHEGSFKNLVGHYPLTDDEMKYFSLEYCVKDISLNRNE